MTTKLDLRRELKHLHMPSANTPVLVDVPRLRSRYGSTPDMMA